MNQIITGDCLKVLPTLVEKSIDMILCDLPYGVTNNKWDCLIPLEPLWAEYKRIIKDNGVIALTAQGIFTAKLIMAAEDLFRYTLIWEKNKPRGFFNARRQPLRKHEDICIFYKKQPVYNPQKTTGHNPVHTYTKHSIDGNSGTNYGKGLKGWSGGGSTERFPTSILKIDVVNEVNTIHPTEKPVELGEWLIKTYTNERALVLDNSCGSGAFLVAAKKLNRQYLGIEIDENYCDLARKRLGK
ncbi:site-specific DNA-methyltransferase [Candidatus Parcubacteria bacterium]|nr:MAG: site-specific DNA-methyltransferase [Candidatus Parcubacteria bacterium]